MTRSPIGCSALIMVCAALLAAPAAAQSVKKLDSYDGVAVRILQNIGISPVENAWPSRLTAIRSKDDSSCNSTYKKFVSLSGSQTT